MSDASLNDALLNEEQTPETTAPEAVEALSLEAQLALAKEGYDELNQRYLRLAADFDNFRKRRQNEVEQQYKFGAEPFLLGLLPVLDNLERGQRTLTSESDAATLHQSLVLMQEQLRQSLEGLGLKRCKSEGEVFDAAKHEAVGRICMPNLPEGQIIGEQQAGYQLHDKLIRVPQVIVAYQEEG